MNRKLLKSHFKLKKLKELSKKSVTYNSAIGRDNMTFHRFKEIEDNVLLKIRENVLNETYDFITYKEKLIVKNRNEIPRCISIPTLADKICLKALNETLKNYYPEYQRTKLPQEWIKKIKEELSKDNKEFFLKIDIKNFFDDINHTLLLNKLKKKIKDSKTISLIKKAIENPTHPYKEKNNKGLPQGIAISNILSNIYLKTLDEYYNKNEDITYIRYVDDLLILCSSQTEAEILKNEIEVKLKKEFYLDINKKKGKIGNVYNENFNFLGYQIGNTSNLKNEIRIVMNERSINKIENKIMNIITIFKRDKKYSIEKMIFNLNLLITGCLLQRPNIDNKQYDRYGWLFHYLQITDITVLYHLDNLVKSKVEKITDNIKINKVKKFSKAYFEMKYNLRQSNYIFKPDEMNKEDKRSILKQFYNLDPDEENIDKTFKKIIFNQIKNYEKDIISHIS